MALCKHCNELIRGTRNAPDVPVHVMTDSRQCPGMKTLASWSLEHLVSETLDFDALAVYVDGKYIPYLKVEMFTEHSIFLTTPVTSLFPILLYELQNRSIEVRGEAARRADSYTNVLLGFSHADLYGYTVYPGGKRDKQAVVAIEIRER